jgi:hypothetical protein
VREQQECGGDVPKRPEGHAARNSCETVAKVRYDSSVKRHRAMVSLCIQPRRDFADNLRDLGRDTVTRPRQADAVRRIRAVLQYDIVSGFQWRRQGGFAKHLPQIYFRGPAHL